MSTGLHKSLELAELHKAHAFEYADATARTGASGFVAEDVNKLALQLDNRTLWILTSTTPTWQSAGGGTSDTDAIHKSVANEISTITEKALPIGSDLLVIEDSAAAGVKKKVQVGNLPSGSGNADWKDAVRAGTTASITRAGTQTIDGVALIAGDRVLVKNQTAANQNGIYVVSSGTWARATDADTSAEVTSGMTVRVNEGTTLAGSLWYLSTPDPIVLDTTGLTFSSTSPGSAAGAKDEIQYRGNQAGSFAATSRFRYDSVTNTLLIGPTTPSGLNSLLAWIADNANTYLQEILSNLNAGTQASSDYVLQNDQGTDSTHYVDLGINSSGYNDPAFPLSLAGDSYLYCIDGNMAIGTGTTLKDLIFHSGGFAQVNERLRIVDAAAAKDALVKLSAVLRLVNDTTANRPTTAANGMIRYNTTTNRAELYENGSWKSLSTNSAFNLTINSGTTPYAATASTSYVVVADFIYRGTSLAGAIAAIMAVAWADVSTTCAIRIYDVTNAQVICEKTNITVNTKGMADLGTISNLPANPAIFEVQIKRAAGSGGAMVYVSSAQVRYS